MILGKVIHLGDNVEEGGNGIGWDGEVLNFSSLPPYQDNQGKVYLVLQSQGSQLFFNLKRSGYYIAEPSGWIKLSNAQNLFIDSEFTVSNSVDATKQLSFNLSNFSANSRREVLFQNRNGVVAYIDDITGIPEAPLDGSLYFRNGQSGSWVKKLGMCETFPISSKENDTNANNGQFHGVTIPINQGFYSSFSTQTDDLNLGNNQTFQLRCAVYDAITSQLISQGSLLLNNTSTNSHNITLDTPFQIDSPKFVKVVVGVNDNSGGGEVRIIRMNANQLNDSSVSFSFSQNNGSLPLLLPSVSNQNNVRYQIYYGA